MHGYFLLNCLLKEGDKMNKLLLLIFILLLISSYFMNAYYESEFEGDFIGIRFTIGKEKYQEVRIAYEGILSKSILRDNIGKVKITENGITHPTPEKGLYILPFNYSGHLFKNGMPEFRPTKYYEGYFAKYGNQNIIYFSNRQVGLGKSKLLTEHGSFIFSENFEIIMIIVPKTYDNQQSVTLEAGTEIIINADSIVKAKYMLQQYFDTEFEL